RAPGEDQRTRPEEARIRRLPLAEPLTVGREAGHAVVPGIGDVDRAVRADGDAARLVELSVALAGSADRPAETAVRVQDVDAGVLGVGHVEIAGGVGRDGPGLVELAGTHAGRPEETRRAELDGVGAVVARGSVLHRELQWLERARRREILPHVERRVLGAD